MNTPSVRLRAVALASLFSLIGHAQAQSSNVTIYGALGLDVLSASHVYNATTGKAGSVVKIEDNAIVNSRIGLKGGEDLGGNTKVIFDLESTVLPDTGASRSPAFWNRNAFVGLTGDYGTFKLGHQWDVSDDYMGNYFVFAYYSPFLMNGFYSLSNYYDNALKYTTPNMGGFEGAVFYSAGEQAGKTSAGQNFQAAAVYNNGPFSGGLVTFSEKDPNGVATNTMYALGASYDFGVLKGRLGLAMADDRYAYDATTKVTDTSGAFKAKLIDVGVDVPVTPAWYLSMDYVLNDKKDSPDDTYYWRGRANYALSKRTSLNFNLIYLKNKGNANFAFITDGNGFAGQAGQSQTIITAGITHAF